MEPVGNVSFGLKRFEQECQNEGDGNRFDRFPHAVIRLSTTIRRFRILLLRLTFAVAPTFGGRRAFPARHSLMFLNQRFGMPGTDFPIRFCGRHPGTGRTVILLFG
jgi:hypothetical protein